MSFDGKQLIFGGIEVLSKPEQKVDSFAIPDAKAPAARSVKPALSPLM